MVANYQRQHDRDARDNRLPHPLLSYLDPRLCTTSPPTYFMQEINIIPANPFAQPPLVQPGQPSQNSTSRSGIYSISPHNFGQIHGAQMTPHLSQPATFSPLGQANYQNQMPNNALADPFVDTSLPYHPYNHVHEGFPNSISPAYNALHGARPNTQSPAYNALHGFHTITQSPAYNATPEGHVNAQSPYHAALLDDRANNQSSSAPMPTGKYGEGFSPAHLSRMIRSGMFDDGNAAEGDNYMASIPTGPARSAALLDHQSPDPGRTNQTLSKLWINHYINNDPLPPFFAKLSEGYVPTLTEALSNLPFVEPGPELRGAKIAACGGVDRPFHDYRNVVLISNIPFDATKRDISAIISSNHSIARQPKGTSFFAIHIIMERTTGKTMDCYVEMETQKDAENVVSYCNKRGKPPRVHHRKINMELSSQSALLQELFPKANRCVFRGQEPEIMPPRDAYDTGFRGFFAPDELNTMVNFTDNPHRSNFAQQNWQRTYENLISTLWKYPWTATQHVTIIERTRLFEVTQKMLSRLMWRLDRGDRPEQLTYILLEELVCAALHTPFAPQQKADIVRTIKMAGKPDVVEAVQYQSFSGFDGIWPFEGIAPKISARPEVVQYYAALLAESSAVLAKASNASPATSTAPSHEALRGFQFFRVEYGVPKLGDVSLRAAAHAEWIAIQTALRKILSDMPDMSSLALRSQPDMSSLALRSQSARSDDTSSNGDLGEQLGHGSRNTMPTYGGANRSDNTFSTTDSNRSSWVGASAVTSPANATPGSSYLRRTSTDSSDYLCMQSPLRGGNHGYDNIASMSALMNSALNQPSNQPRSQLPPGGTGIPASSRRTSLQPIPETLPTSHTSSRLNAASANFVPVDNTPSFPDANADEHVSQESQMRAGDSAGNESFTGASLAAIKEENASTPASAGKRTRTWAQAAAGAFETP